MTQLFEITGVHTADVNIPVPDKARRILAEQGVTDVPDHITLHLREADLEERERYGRAEALARAQQNTGQFLTELLMQRAAEGTDERVVAALVRVIVPSAAAKLTHAFMHGEFPKAEGPTKP